MRYHSNPCCQFCAVPKLSILFSILTAVALAALLYVNFTGPKKYRCVCEGIECCEKDVDRCGEDQCWCENMMEEDDDKREERGYCGDEKKRLTGVSRVLSVILLLVTLSLAVISMATCCCFGQFARENGVLGPLGPVGPGIPIIRSAQTA